MAAMLGGSVSSVSAGPPAGSPRSGPRNRSRPGITWWASPGQGMWWLRCWRAACAPGG